MDSANADRTETTAESSKANTAMNAGQSRNRRQASSGSATSSAKGSLRGRVANLMRKVSRKDATRRSTQNTVTPMSSIGSLPGNLIAYNRDTRPTVVARNSIDVAKARARRLLNPAKSRLSSSSTFSSTPSSIISVYSKPGPKIFVTESAIGADHAGNGSRISVRFKEKVKRPRSCVSYNEIDLRESLASSAHADGTLSKPQLRDIVRLTCSNPDLVFEEGVGELVEYTSTTPKDSPLVDMPSTSKSITAQHPTATVSTLVLDNVDDHLKKETEQQTQREDCGLEGEVLKLYI